MGPFLTPDTTPFPVITVSLLPVSLGVPQGLSLMLKAFHKPEDLPTPSAQGWRSGVGNERKPTLMKHQLSEHQEEDQRQEGDRRIGGEEMTQWPSSFFNCLFQLDFLSYFICAFGFSWLSEWIFPWGILYPSVHTHCSLVQELEIPGPSSCFDGPF